MSWASLNDVVAYTRVQVDDGTLAAAQGTIDLFSNVTESASGNLKARDLLLLKMACAYQAGWMASQPDLMARMDIKSINQDGMAFDPAHRDALVLSPLAQRCLAKLSWRRTHSVPVGHPDDRFRKTKNWTTWREAQDVRGYPELGPYGELPYEEVGGAGDDVMPERGAYDDGTYGWEPM